MEWIDKLPWWVKWASAAGVGIILAALASFWIGVILVCLAALGAALHWLQGRGWAWRSPMFRYAESLEKLADDDERSIDQRVISTGYATRAKLGAPEPNVEIMLNYFNGTAFTISLSGIEGRIKYNEHDLQNKPEISVENMRMLHATHGVVTIRQYLSPEIVRLFDDEISAGRAPTLQIGNFALHFTYHNRRDQPKELRIAGGGPLTVTW